MACLLSRRLQGHGKWSGSIPEWPRHKQRTRIRTLEIIQNEAPKHPACTKCWKRFGRSPTMRHTQTDLLTFLDLTEETSQGQLPRVGGSSVSWHEITIRFRAVSCPVRF